MTSINWDGALQNMTSSTSKFDLQPKSVAWAVPKPERAAATSFVQAMDWQADVPGSSGLERFNGTISAWTPGGKFGFIKCEETFATYGKDCWVHSQQIGNFSCGDAVSFTLTLNKGGNPQAIDLEPFVAPMATFGVRKKRTIDISSSSGLERFNGIISA